MAGAWVGTALLLAACGSQTTEMERSAAAAPSTEAIAEADTTTSAPPSTTVPPAPSTTAPPAVATASTPTPASDPVELGQRLTAAEGVVRSETSSDEQIAAAAFELQVLYRQLGRRADWEPAVLDAMDPAHRFAAWANASARREFRDMHSRLSDTLPAWRIIDPAPAEELLSYFQEGEATFGVPWEILAGVNLVETGMGRIRGVSVAGAQGPMQFMPATWDAFGEGDVNNPRDAIMAAARYLAHNGGGSGDIDNALWNYNHDNRYVRGVKHYASIMEDDPRTYRAFHNWQIVYLSERGDIWLPTGYEQPERITVTDYLAANPGHHLGTATG